MICSKEATAEIQAIYDERGEVRASWVVERSKPQSSALHAYINWDDKSAAEAHRLNQARQVLRVVRITTGESTEAQPLMHVPTWSTEEEREGAYQVVGKIVQDKDAYARTLDEATRRLAAASFAVQQLKDAAHDAQDLDLAKITVAVESLAMAREALRSLH